MHSLDPTPSDQPAAPRAEWVWTVILWALVNLASWAWQPAIAHNGGRGWDGVFYHQMATQLAAGEPLSSQAPFVYRPGTPWLAGKLAGWIADERVSLKDSIDAFRVVNLLGGLLATALLVLWLRRWIAAPWVRGALVAGFLVLWHAPVRFLWFYPVNSDAWGLAFLLAALLVADTASRRRSSLDIAALCAVVGIGVLFREVVLLAALAALVASERGGRLRLLMPCAVGVLAIVLTRTLASPTSAHSFVATALRFAYEKPLLIWVHAWWITYGPVLVLIAFSWRIAGRLLGENRLLAVYGGGIAVLSWVGGTDTERFLLWAAPVVLVALGRVLCAQRELLARSPVLVVVLVLSQAVASRLFWVTPDVPSLEPTPFPLLTPWTGSMQYLDLWSFHAQRGLGIVSLAEYLILSVMIWLRLQHLSSTAASEMSAENEC